MDNKLLSSNRKLAENRLESTKRKLIATGKFEEYQDVLDLWLSGKIIEEVNDDKENFVHYLPHRPVIKENSTSKIRPVFDASARTKGSPSLNDCLEKGPNFIEVIPTILNRFRKYRIGVISDIEKAFLQIGVREQDRDFLRFMWYDRENRDHIKIYRHRRVVFGVTSSPFLLGATLNHHLDNAHGNFDNVAKILRKSFYVDNCVTSFETEEQLQKFIVESKILLSSAHFNLRGWQSNILLNPENFSELESQPDNFETMVLGLIWNLKDDCLSCNINCQKNEGKAITKRSLLSIANHIFDPIGFTAPVTLKPKLILQEIWKLKLKWDENLPKDILNQVKKWLEQLPILASIKIPRCLNLSSNGIKRLTLHVFCDASKKAYAACVFLRVEYEENVFVKLIQAKARVAPLKDISIPRLELLACVLGTRLAASVKNGLNLPDVRIYYLTDSMTALAWIQRTRDWGVFVSNRVKEIRNLSDVSSWEHVPSEKNFADILSRAQQLVYLRWWEGPSWLSETPVQCPRSKQVPDEETNRTLWSLARVIQLIPGKDGHVRVARVKTETGELARPVQRLYNLELQEPDINLSKDLTDSVIRTRRGRKRKDSGLPRDYGLSFTEIGSRVRRNHTTVMRICDRWMQEGTTDQRGRSHPPHCTTSVCAYHSTPFLQSGLSARRPLLGLPLKQNPKRLHHQWCDERRMWMAELNEVVFIDKPRICLQHHDGQIRVWRHRGERMLNSCDMHCRTGPTPGIMVWGGIGYHSRTPLVRISGTLNSQRYISEIELLPWPARSPDLSPIENIWSMVTQRLTQITPQAATPDQLWQRVEAARSAVPQEHIQSLFESMPRRVAAVMSNNGGYSGY
ncbi:integrase catalytic domain-containing protein [Trichonephila clavipes]|nr:integrase catalytic domain-containing protein [Trichonephila clavipes]